MSTASSNQPQGIAFGNTAPAPTSESELVQQLHGRRNHHIQRLGEILLARGWLSRTALDQALFELKGKPGEHLGHHLVAQGLLNAEQLTEALAEQFGIPRVNLVNYPLRPEVVALVPSTFALQHSVLPLALDGNVLLVATADPFDDETMSTLRFLSGHPVEPVLASAQDIGQALNRGYVTEAATLAAEELQFQEPATPQPPRVEVNDPYREAMRKPLVRLVDAIILQAVHRGASDINIRPSKEGCTIYFRVDGLMRPVRTLSLDLVPALIARIKITANMDVTERRLPQDGHTRVIVAGRSIDLRVSIIPTITGESVVIRVLDKERGLRPMDDLGFSDTDLQRLRSLISRPHGLFLVTGPTGSGKSTTLYSVLQAIRSGEPHIITVENPVEYDIDGVEQIQVHPAIGYDFAQALRHILRHDPDVIMIGEIRDSETATIANKAALTGHLVLSTLHTNDAPGAVTRLLDIGVEPFLLSATLLGAMAQRLVGLNCPHCLTEEQVDPQLRRALEVGDDDVFHVGAGCEKCDGSGVAGRGMVYELMTVDGELPRLIARGRPAEEVRATAIGQGMTPMPDHALALARAGRISLREAYRIRLS